MHRAGRRQSGPFAGFFAARNPVADFSTPWKQPSAEPKPQVQGEREVYSAALMRGERGRANDRSGNYFPRYGKPASRAESMAIRDSPRPGIRPVRGTA